MAHCYITNHNTSGSILFFITKCDMFTDHNITLSFKYEVPWVCNQPTSIFVKACHNLPKIWKPCLPCMFPSSLFSTGYLYPYSWDFFILEYLYSWNSPKLWNSLMLKYLKANGIDSWKRWDGNKFKSFWVENNSFI